MPYVYVNDALAAINGCAAAAYAGKTVEENLPSPVAAEVRTLLATALATGIAAPRVRVRGQTTRDQGERVFDCDDVPVWHAAANRTGKPTHVAALVRDVTSEAGMSDQLDLLRSILQQSTDALYVMRPDQQFRFVYVNQAAERHYGRPAADLLTLRATDLDPQWTLADFDDHQHSVELGDLFRCAHHDRDATRAKHDLRAGGDEPPVVPDAHDDEPQLVVQRQLPDGLVLEGRTRHGKLGELQTIMDRLIANPSPRGFVSALIRGFNPRVQFGTDDTNLTVDVQADSDFCFFGVRAHFQRTALESRSTEATGSVEGAMLIGPSALAMRQLALRAGPGADPGADARDPRHRAIGHVAGQLELLRHLGRPHRVGHSRLVRPA